MAKSALENVNEYVEGIDQNRRSSLLILTCDKFTDQSEGENVEAIAIEALNKRLHSLTLTEADVQNAHRLQGKNKIIVRFVKRRVRDEIFESRFQLPSRQNGAVKPLFLTESLTPRNRHLYTALLDARRPQNGGRIASVFTRRSQVWCRTERCGANIKVPDETTLRRILSGAPSRRDRDERPRMAQSSSESRRQRESTEERRPSTAADRSPGRRAERAPAGDRPAGGGAAAAEPGRARDRGAAGRDRAAAEADAGSGRGESSRGVESGAGGGE